MWSTHTKYLYKQVYQFPSFEGENQRHFNCCSWVAGTKRHGDAAVTAVPKWKTVPWLKTNARNNVASKRIVPKNPPGQLQINEILKEGVAKNEFFNRTNRRPGGRAGKRKDNKAKETHLICDSCELWWQSVSLGCVLGGFCRCCRIDSSYQL